MKKWFIGLLVICASVAASAQVAFPSRPLTIVVGFAAGAPLDTLARMMAEGMSKDLGQQIIVENRPGAGGTIGATVAAKSTADG